MYNIYIYIYLHTLVAGDPVEGMLVASSAPAQHRFSPAAELDARVRADHLVALLGQRLAQRVAHLAKGNPNISTYIYKYIR